MSEWVDVDAVSSLPEGSVSLVDVNGTEVAVFNIDGHYYAIHDVCTHDGALKSSVHGMVHVLTCARARSQRPLPMKTSPPLLCASIMTMYRCAMNAIKPDRLPYWMLFCTEIRSNKADICILL